MTVLITGGAGFIGSSLIRSLLDSGGHVQVLDDLSTGSLDNLRGVESSVELIVGDIRDEDLVRRAVAGVEVIHHLAALPSVGRSIRDPRASNAVNADATLGLLVAARDAGVRRIVYASSSSIYGDTPELPKREDMPVATYSPYAASKLAAEAYCRAFSRSFGLETVSLRLFNVFGPRQDPGSEYAAVIPRFITEMTAGRRPTIFGDGQQSRDFTFVENAVDAFRLAATAGPEAAGEVMNVGCDDRITLLDLVGELNRLLGTDLAPSFEPARVGDVRHSQASVSKARELIGYVPAIDVRRGLERTVGWFTSGDEEPASAGTVPR